MEGGSGIIDARERRKVSSNTVRPLVPNLSRLAPGRTLPWRKDRYYDPAAFAS